jgi:HEPN domain-containing protein
MQEERIVREEGLLWLGWADRDYIGARQLLLSGLLVQGASLAATAIEKYLKTFFVLRDLPFPKSHDPLALYKQLGFETRILDTEFLSVLTKAYSLRYPDDLPNGFNIALSQVLLLTRLDTTVHILLRDLKIRNSKGPIQHLLERAVTLNDRQVLDGNVAFEPSLLLSLYQNQSRCLDFHKHQNGAVLEFQYTVARLDPDVKFDRVALEQKSDREFILAFGTPLQG